MKTERKIHEVQGHQIEELIPSEEISIIVNELAREIEKNYEGEDVRFVVVLNGAMTFYADLQRAVDPNLVNITTDTMGVSSYETGTESSRSPKITKDLDHNIEGKNVIVIEDIADTRYSLELLLEILKVRGPASLQTCVFLNKPSRQEVDIQLDYVGREIPDKFVVGYGLDKDGMFRGLPYVGVIVGFANNDLGE